MRFFAPNAKNQYKDFPCVFLFVWVENDTLSLKIRIFPYILSITTPSKGHITSYSLFFLPENSPLSPPCTSSHIRNCTDRSSLHIQTRRPTPGVRELPSLPWSQISDAEVPRQAKDKARPETPSWLSLELQSGIVVRELQRTRQVRLTQQALLSTCPFYTA